MKCPQCKNPTEISFDRECEWCGHIIPLSAGKEGAGATGSDPLKELQQALLDAETAARNAYQNRTKGTGDTSWSGLLHRVMDSFRTGVLEESMSLENMINHAKANVVGAAILAQDRPSLERMLDMAEAQAAATKVSWWNSAIDTEGEEALHKAWKALAKRVNKALARQGTNP